MKYPVRFIALAGFVIWFLMWSSCKTALTGFGSSSTGDNTEIRSRLIVFGDSFCDKDWTLTTVSKEGSVSPKSQGYGQVWTEIFCAEIDCIHENYATSSPYAFGSGYTGALVDNRLHNVSGASGGAGPPTLPDLRNQVNMWQKQQKRGRSKASSGVQQSHLCASLVLVSFGGWDIWHLASRPYKDAVYAVEASVDVIFQTLEYIARDCTTKTKVRMILLTAPDPTFFPMFHKNAAVQRQAVSLVKLWNMLLTERVETWRNGLVYVYDLQSFIITQIRTWHLIATPPVNDNQFIQNTTFQSVVIPCIGLGAHVLPDGERICSDPWNYLFWDDIHLGPQAHYLIAREIVRDLKALSEPWI